MKCPKCQAFNPEEAKFCSFCYENFVAKPAAKPPSLFFPDVTAEFGYWETVGPLLITRESVFFFFDKYTDISDRKSMKKKMHNNLSEFGMTGAVLGLAFNKAFEEKMPVRPEEVHIKFVHWDKDPLQAWVDYKPNMGAHDQYFALEKKELTKIKAGLFGHFTFSTVKADVKTMAMEKKDLITAFLRSSGYPLEVD